MMLTVCSNANLLSVMVIVKKIIDLLQVIAPVGLIIFASLDVIKAIISSKQDEIYKKLHMIPKRAFAAIIIFFVPVIIDLIMNLVDNTFEYAACFENATEEYVQEAYTSNAYEAVSLAETSQKRLDYEEASLLTSKIKDEQIKATLKERLAIIFTAIKEKKAKTQYGSTKHIPSTNSGDYGNDGPLNSGSVTFKDSNVITKTALNHLGTVYVYGGESWSGGVDCSGFVYRVFADTGYSMARDSASNYRSLGCSVSNIESAKPGDFLIYGTRHVALYLGEDTTGTKWRVHASGDENCNGKTATGCQVKKDTNVIALRSGESLTIRRLSGSC